MKDIIREWFYANAQGYRREVRKKDAFTFIKWQLPISQNDDREFRELCADIPEIITSTDGYYILPLVDLSGEETHHALEIINGQSRRRMIALYLRQRRQRKAIHKMRDTVTQPEFSLI